MKALVIKQTARETGGEPVLAVEDVPTPRPGPRQALVRVTACGFCHHDRAVMAGTLRRGVGPGVILGHEISGVVEEAGSSVAGLRAGDRVVSILTEACGVCDRCAVGREHRCREGQGIGHGRDGGFAEFVALSEHSLVRFRPFIVFRDFFTNKVFLSDHVDYLDEVDQFLPRDFLGK